MKRLKLGRIFFLTVFLVLVISGCSETSGSLIEIGNQELALVLESDSGILVYVGRPTCPACVEFEPILKNALSELEKGLYYFNMDDAMEKSEEDMLTLLEALEVIVVPTVIYIENGIVVSRLNGLHTESDIIEFLETYANN